MIIDNNNSSFNLADSSLELDNSLISNDNITPQLASNSPYDSIIGETGSATLNHNQKTIHFTEEYENPIIFATSLSRKGVESDETNYANHENFLEVYNDPQQRFDIAERVVNAWGSWFSDRDTIHSTAKQKLDYKTSHAQAIVEALEWA